MSRFRALLILLSLVSTVSGCSKSSPTAPHSSGGPASLVVRSIPSGAEIILNGTSVNLFTPATLNPQTGQNQIGLSKLGYRDTTLTVSVTAGMVDTLIVPLGPQPGTPRSFSTWRRFAGEPEQIAAAPVGPIYVIAGVADGSGTSAVYAFSTAGDLLGSSSLGLYANRLAVGPVDDAYLARGVSGFGTILEHYGRDASYQNTIYYTNSFAPWPGVPCAAAGTGDTLMVLCNAPQNAVVGQVDRYVNDHLIDLWRSGIDAGSLVVDGIARRCYFMGASDSVHVLTTGGQPITSWKAGLYLNRAGSMTLAPDGTLYLADATTIYQYTGDGVPLAAWAVEQIGTITGIAVDTQGRVYVVGYGTKQVVRYMP